MTALMTVKSRTDQASSSQYDFLDYMADCVIHLDQRVLEQVTTRRLRVTKNPGSAYGRNEYPFGITDKGIWIIPVTQAGLGECLSSGVDQLDDILGGCYQAQLLYISPHSPCMNRRPFRMSTSRVWSKLHP